MEKIENKTQILCIELDMSDPVKELNDLLHATKLPDGTPFNTLDVYYESQKKFIMNTLKTNSLDLLFDYLMRPENKSDVLCINIGCGYNSHLKTENGRTYDQGHWRFYKQFGIVNGLVNSEPFDEYQAYTTNYVLIDPQFNRSYEKCMQILGEHELDLVEKLDDNIYKLKSKNESFKNLTVYFVSSGFFMGNLVTRYYKDSIFYKQKVEKFTQLINTYTESGVVMINSALKFFAQINISDDGFFFKYLESILNSYVKSTFPDRKRLILTEFNFDKENVEVMHPIEIKKDLDTSSPIIIGKKDTGFEIIVFVQTYDRWGDYNGTIETKLYNEENSE